MFRMIKNILPQTIATQSNDIFFNSGNMFSQHRQISKTIPHYKKQLEHVDIPDEVEEVDVTVKCTKRKPRHPRMVDGCPGLQGASCSVNGCPIPLEAQTVLRMGYGDRDACQPKTCKKFILQCPQARPKRPVARVCIGKKRWCCKLIALAVFLAAIVAGYTYMAMSSRDGDGGLDKCVSGGKDQCECCTDKEAMICCTFVEEPEK